MKPVIGITPSPLRDDAAHVTRERFALTTTYVAAVVASGAIPLILPPVPDDALQLLDRIDGLLLSGGADVDPARYGDAFIHATTYDVHPLRDAFEIDLLRSARARDLPTLCICRGIQVLNVALGGTLIQDIGDQLANPLTHRQQELGISADQPSHQVALGESVSLPGFEDQSFLMVNSYHHQAIRDLAPDLRVAARAADGVIEAVVLPGTSFIVGVQWHPEMMFHRHPEQAALFRGLTIASTANRTALAGR